LDLRDPVSSISHLLTAVWAVFATLVMLRLTPHRRGVVLVYGLSMVALYSASATFHGLHYDTPEEKRFYQKIDQSCIYTLIAGAYTPPFAILLTGAWRRWCLRVIWGLAVAGVACLWLLPKAHYSLVVAVYLSMGWVGLVPLVLLYKAVGWRAMSWVWLGAAFFSLGAVCELLQWPVLVPGWVAAHEMLHFCDTAGSVTYFVFITRYVLPHQARGAPSVGPYSHDAGALHAPALRHSPAD
jgi:hemolysin III